MGKTFFNSSASLKKPIVAFAPNAEQINNAGIFRSTYSSLSDELGQIRVNDIADTSGFKDGDLVNIRPNQQGVPSIDSTVFDVGVSQIIVTAAFVENTGPGVLSQRFNPPQP